MSEISYKKRMQRKKEYIDSYYDETFLKSYFKKRELKIKK